MKTTLKITLTLVATLALLACGNENGTTPPTPKPPINLKTPKLTRVSSCEDFLKTIQQKQIEQLEKTRQSYNGCPSYQGSDEYGYGSATGTSSSAEESVAMDSTGPTNYTGTNLQENNIDETDIIKTNGTHIFVATSKGVDVFQAWPLADFGKIASVEIEDGVSQLILHDDTLVALSNRQTEIYPSDNILIDSGEMPQGTPENVAVNLIDVQDPAKAHVYEQQNITGYLINTRLIDGVLHIATNTTGITPVSLDYVKIYQARYSSKCTDTKLAETLDNLVNEAKEKILAQTWQDVLPEDLECEEIMFDTTNDVSLYNMLTGLTSIDLNNASPVKKTFVLGTGEEVYASENSFYLIGNQFGASGYTYGYGTVLHRFALDREKNLHDYFTSTVLEGQYLNSFSFSEYKNTLRVAVYGMAKEKGMMTGAPYETRVLVLDITLEGLPELGQVTDLGRGEQLYGVRFFGERGYVVTYRKVDPLYVLDLSDPKNPKVRGELKMPGFSTYLHWLDENHIIGLGKDAEEVSGANFSWFQGLKLAVFDVSDETKPVISDEIIIGARGTSSYALDDHHAFTFDVGTGRLALPLTFFEESQGINQWGKFGYNGVHVFQIDAKNGITEDAIVSLPASASEPKRTIMVGDENEMGLFVLDDFNLYLFDMTDNYNLVGSEKLDHEIYWYGWCGTDVVGMGIVPL